MNLEGLRGALLGAGLVVLAFVIWMLLAGGCKLTSNTEPTDANYPVGDAVVETYPDDSPQALASPCGLACKHLAELHCPEGGATCYRACLHQVALERVPVACWTKAPTVADVRACGPQLRCLP